MSFAELGLESGLLRAVQNLGYVDPTPIQEQAIPLAIAGRDVLGCAQTGTGKTAAFILPALQRMGRRKTGDGDKTPGGRGSRAARASNRLLKNDVSPSERDGHAGEKDTGSANSGAIRATEDVLSRRTARSDGRGFVSQQPANTAKAAHGCSGIHTLVVTPTRELAGQIDEVARGCAKYTGRRIAAVYGGVGYEPQIKKLRRGVDLLVATPGRLLDLQQRGDIDLSQVEILVLDEADRMLDMGFWPDVRRIMNLLPARRQNMLFSATLTNDVMRVAGPILTDPVRVEVAPSATPVESISQAVYPVAEMQKTDLLVRLLEEQRLDRVLVFTRTKHRADRVCRHLERNRIKGAAIHSNRTQAQRQKALNGFKDGTYRVLVATDIVARGIDVDRISHVVNYDLPSQAQDYVHRIGRTARAGTSGTAISFLAAEQANELREIEMMLGQTLPCQDLEGFAYMQRLVPSPDRTTKKPKPRLVYNGSARRRR